MCRLHDGLRPKIQKEPGKPRGKPKRQTPETDDRCVWTGSNTSKSKCSRKSTSANWTATVVSTKFVLIKQRTENWKTKQNTHTYTERELMLSFIDPQRRLNKPPLMCKFLHCLTFILFVLHFIYWSRFLFSYRADFHFRFTESESETLPSMFVVKHSFYVYEESIFYKQFYKHVEQSKQACYQSAVCKDVLILLK